MGSGPVPRLKSLAHAPTPVGHKNLSVINRLFVMRGF